ISVISHEGTDYTLPSVADRTFSTRVLDALDKIKTGELADKFGWIQKI
ncbi:MAG TPA: branched chain amino acid aminotransferase, partial [Cytophagales bacterium]|nr:branched chain amino acid aminotransferase [Cytophagales bacterium]